MKIDITKDELEELYLNQNLSQEEIAKRFGCKREDIKLIVKKLGLKKSRKQITDAIKKTNLERYGSEVSSKSELVKEKAKQTNLKKYGVEYFVQTSEFKEKSKQSCLDKYGVENPHQSDEVKEKSKQTCMDRYGVPCYLLTQESQNQRKQTNLDKYGVEYYVQAPNFQEQSKQTCLRKYGVENVMQSSEIKEKAVQTLLDKYGVTNIMKSSETIEKNRQICLEKYGVPSYAQTTEFRMRMLSHLPKEKQIEWIAITESAEEFQSFTAAHRLNTAYKISEYFGVGVVCVYDTLKKLHIFDLYSHAESYLETDIKNFLNELNIKYEKTKSIISPLELDVYCPDYQLAIEMNGDYWHSSLYKEKDYHFHKSRLCEEKNIQLIHIFEHEWEDSQQRTAIKSLLKNIFIKNSSVPISDCIIREITDDEIRAFIEQNDIKNYEMVQFAYGLFHRGELIQTMGFTYLNDELQWKIIDACTKIDYVQYEGYLQLFNYFVRMHNPDRVFITCDFNKSNGEPYSEMGFQFVGYSGPSLITNDNLDIEIWDSGFKIYVWTK